MDCHQAKTAVSALLDGEDPGVTETALASHLASCASCQSSAHALRALHRRVRVRPAEPVPDLSAGIMLSLAQPDRDPRALGVRICLAGVGLLQLAVAAPALLVGTETGLSTHAARHAGAFAIALAIGFLIAAWRPVYTDAILIVTAVLVVCLFGAGVADVAAGRTGSAAELGHAPELIGLLALWMLRRHFVAPERVTLDMNT